MSGYCGFGHESLSAGFSTWNSKNGWSLFAGCATPPATPFDVPPAAPFPEKSASSVTFFVRSISGITSGISTGAVSTWNPFGGGGAATTSFGGGGGGGSSLGGGGSSGFTSVNWIFSSRGFSVSIAACAVA